MRHQPFVQALTDCGDEHRPGWAALCSGLLVLRHFDDWLAIGPACTGEDREAAARVRRQIGTIPDSTHEVRYLLGTVLDVLGQAKPTDMIGAVGPLLAYGSYLEQENQQKLGQYVLSIVAQALDSPIGREDLQSVAGAYIQYGRAAHRAGNFYDAEVQYTRGIALAEQAGDYALALQAKALMGIVLNSRGNLADAEMILTAVITEAKQHRFTAVEVYALHIRGGTLQRRRRLLRAISDFAAAYELTPDPSLRELLLSDLATCANDLGLWQTGKAIHEKVARTARNPLAKGCALVNLIEAAVMQGDQERYQTLCQELTANHAGSLPFELGMYVEYYAAQSAERFLGTSDAIVAYRAVADRAKEVGIHFVEFMAHDRLEALLTLEKIIA